MVTAPGFYRPGSGYASANLQVQAALIARTFPKIRNYHLGTVNVEFDPMIVVVNPDHRTPPLPWTGTLPGEVFDFLEVQLTFSKPAIRLGGLMYIAHWSGLRSNPHLHEFLVERFVDGLEMGQRVLMQCGCPRAVQLPYANGITIVI